MIFKYYNSVYNNIKAVGFDGASVIFRNSGFTFFDFDSGFVT